MTYLNQDGLESYLSYHNAGGGSMGTVSVGDFNGNLVYTFDDLSLSGEYMPVSIQHIYNHSRRDDANMPNSHMHYGKGFRLNLSQKIIEISDPELTALNYCYKMRDADGTMHYFKLASGTAGANNSTYEKEFETTTVLTKKSYGFILTYNGDLENTFNTSGLLTKIKDTSNGKEMSLTYDGNSRLTIVTDGANRQTTLTYNSSGYLTKITDPAGRDTTYSYSNNRLTSITSPDGNHVDFTYTSTSNGYMLTRITDIDGSYLSIAYYSNSPCRVKSIEEFGTSGGAGGKLTWTYSGGETTVTDREGHSETMMFDSSGHTVCIRDEGGRAYFGSYGSDDAEPDNNTKHALQVSSNLQASVTNYLKNHSFENSQTGWSTATYGTGAGSIEVTTAEHYRGEHSLKLTSTSMTGGYGISQTQTVEGAAGGSVTLSAMIKVESITPETSDTAGILLDIAYQDSNQNWVYSRPFPVKETGGWVNFVHSVDIPEGSGNQIRARLIFVRSTGVVYIDCMQLEKGHVANRYNLLENGHFRDAAGTAVPEGWTGSSELGSDDKVVSSGRDGKGFQIEGSILNPKNIRQTLNISGSAGDSYVYGAWAKADAIKTLNNSPHVGSGGEERPFGIRIRFNKSNGGHEDVIAGFEAKTSGWQYLSGCAVAPCDYVSVEFLIRYSHQKNTAVFDDAQLYREGFGDVIEYDEDGRVEKVTDPMGRVTEYEYQFDHRPEVKKIKYPDGSQTEYTYSSSNHRLTSVKDSSGKIATYHYDSDGNNTSVSMAHNGTTLSSGEKAFGDGYLTSSTDSLGNTTTYEYNTNMGLLTKVTEANSVAINYAYNADNDLVTQVSSGSSNVQYTYNNYRRLTGLTHTAGTSGSVGYSLIYNQFGARTAVKVGSQNLASYTYASNNGKLTKTTYGNGAYTEPVYDSLDRQTGLKVNGIEQFKWHYGADSRVGLEEDYVNDITWRYLYNKDGEITNVQSSEGDRLSFNYSSGKLTQSAVTSGISTIKNLYSYDSNTHFLNTITFKAGSATAGTLGYTYDDFERINQKTLTTQSGSVLTTAYVFKDGVDPDTPSTTLIPEQMTTTAGGNTYQFDYTYDCMGNIATVTHPDENNDPKTTRYSYDSLNQLVREDNQAAGKTWVYSYDLGGNILSAKEYAYTTGNLGSVLSTKNYVYNDSEWQDKLTSYAGTTISYDAIGNPLSYRNGMTFTWQAGRQLATATSGGVTTSYTYNSSGIRTSKTVGNTTTRYILSGTQVAKAVTGDDYVLYYYDENGVPISFRTRVNGVSTNYYYVKNLQGDIVAITNNAGTKVVEYTYDAWGKVLTTTGSLASTIGTTNPYRYRGYWFDTETGLYYLQSRYYDPQTGRFINADIYINTEQGMLSSNVFSYCLNNPVNGYDPTGETNWTGVIVGVMIMIGSIILSTGTGGAAGTASAAVFATGATVTYAAATDSSMVVDLSYTCPLTVSEYCKGGVSLITDFGENGGVYGYSHKGLGIGQTMGASYSVGFVDNLKKPEDYSEHFIDMFVSGVIGLEYCFNPTKEYKDTIKAKTISFGIGPSFFPYNYGIGYDYYSDPLVFWKWGADAQ